MHLTKSPQTTNKNNTPLQSIEASESFKFWALEYMGPLPETGRGNKHILVLMDHFELTEWCEAFPTSDQKASTVAKLLQIKYSVDLVPQLSYTPIKELTSRAL